MKRWLPLLILLLIPSFPFAQSGVELTPFFGYRGGGEFRLSALNQFEDVEIDESESYGVLVGFTIAPWSQIILEASFQESTLGKSSGDFQPGIPLGDVDVAYYHIGYQMQSPGPQLQWFGVVTIGATTIDPHILGLESETKFSASFGGGLKLNFNQHLGLRLEGRGYYTVLESDNNGCCHNDYDWNYVDLFQGEARVGLIIKF